MNSNFKSSPPAEGRQGLVDYPIIKNPCGLMGWDEGGLRAARLFKPTREISPKRGSLSGHVPFLALQQNVWHESSLEKDLLTVLKPFDGLLGVLQQPLKLQCSDLGFDGGTYTPDLIAWVRLKTTPVLRPVLIEVKFEEDLRENWLTLRPKLQAARRFARRQGWRFLLMSARHLRVPRPLPPLLSRERVRPYDLHSAKVVLSRLFGPGILEFRQ